MSNILITGATGNIGHEVIWNLFGQNTKHTIIGGVRNIEKAQIKFQGFKELQFRHFDFEKLSTYENALEHIDIIFLLRPPHISEIEKYFHPFIAMAKEKGITNIVFLSVQGVETSKSIPHNKIERLIRSFELNYIFLRPSYFMQNLTTALLDEIKQKRTIMLPSGSAKFNWIDLHNIGEVAAILLNDFENYKNQAFDITGLENENFQTVVSYINNKIETPIKFKSVNLFRFYRSKKKEGMEKGKIMVTLLLHFLPRFQKEPVISNFYEQVTGKQPTSLEQFVEREKHLFEN